MAKHDPTKEARRNIQKPFPPTGAAIENADSQPLRGVRVVGHGPVIPATPFNKESKVVDIPPGAWPPGYSRKFAKERIAAAAASALSASRLQTAPPTGQPIENADYADDDKRRSKESTARAVRGAIGAHEVARKRALRRGDGQEAKKQARAEKAELSKLRKKFTGTSRKIVNSAGIAEQMSMWSDAAKASGYQFASSMPVGNLKYDDRVSESELLSEARARHNDAKFAHARGDTKAAKSALTAGESAIKAAIFNRHRATLERLKARGIPEK